MDNLNELKALWRTANTNSLPDAAEMLKAVRQYRNQTLRKKLFLIVLALIMAALMVVLIFVYKPALLTTRIGEGLMVMALAIIGGTNLKSIGRFYHLQDCSNKEFIAFLEQTRLNQIRFYKRTQVIALLLLAGGLLLYQYEFVYTDTSLLLVTYTLAIAYLLILSLVVRPRVYKKEAAKINVTLDKLHRISNQFNDENQ